MKAQIVLCALVFSGGGQVLAQQPASETPPPPCMLTLGSAGVLYPEPRPGESGVAVSPDQPLQIVGQSGAYYAVASPGASAGAVGTLLLSWLPVDAPEITLEGGCETLPVFYPLLYAGAVCTALTGPQGMAYAAPDAGADAEELPGIRVEVLARTEDGWLGYDPARGDDARGGARLRWISPDAVEQTDGDCAAVPAISSATPAALSEQDNGAALSLRLGDSVVIRLSSNPSTGYRWQADAANSPSIALQQGAPQFVPGANAGMPGAGGTEVFTLVAAEAGTAVYRFVYARSWETDVTPQPDDVFTVTLTVRP